MTTNDMYGKFAGSVAGELSLAEGAGATPAETNQILKSLLQSFTETNSILRATSGLTTGIPDRRSGQTYYIDIGLTIPDIQPASGDYANANILVDTSRISELVSPSLGDVDIKFAIGVDSFTIHRYREPSPLNKVWPISVVCDKLQSASGARYLTVLSGESGTALSGTAQTMVFGEIPSSLEFKIGFMSPLPISTNGVLDRIVYPLAFGDAWKDDTQEGKKAPRVIGTDELLWASSNIYAMTLRLYCIPQITPRVRFQST